MPDNNTGIESLIKMALGLDEQTQEAFEQTQRPFQSIDDALMSVAGGAWNAIDEYANSPGRQERNREQWQALAPGRLLERGLQWGFLPPNERDEFPSITASSSNYLTPGSTSSPSGSAGGIPPILQFFLDNAAQAQRAQVGQRGMTTASPQGSVGQSDMRPTDRYSQMQEEGIGMGETGYGFSPPMVPDGMIGPPQVRREVLDGEPTEDKALELLDALEMAGHSPHVQDPNTGWDLAPDQIRQVLTGENTNPQTYIPYDKEHRKNLLEPAYVQLRRQYQEAEDMPAQMDRHSPEFAQQQIQALQNSWAQNNQPQGSIYQSSDFYPVAEGTEQEQTEVSPENELAGQSLPVPNDHVLNLVSQLPSDVSQWQEDQKTQVINSALSTMDPQLRTELSNSVGDDELVEWILEGWNSYLSSLS